jgi:hypothetical protein
MKKAIATAVAFFSLLWSYAATHSSTKNLLFAVELRSSTKKVTATQLHEEGDGSAAP